MRISKGTMILLANGAKALLYRNDGGVDNLSLTVISEAEIENPATSQQGTDTPGRTQASAGANRSSYSETDLHQEQEDAFARETAEKLEAEVSQNPDAGIIIVAAPRVLGVLRNHYGRSTREQMVAEIDKDLTNSPKDRVSELLSAYGED
jgi:protein required for attachment to host cells